LVQAKFSRRSGLYIVVNPDDTNRTGRMPDGTAVIMRARSYRAFLNTVNADGTHTIQEVVLPGQPSYGDLNAHVNRMPNAYRTNSSIGYNQVLRIPQGGGVDGADTGYASPTVPTAFPTYADSYFYDMRRGDGSNGYPFNRPSNNFIPRPIAKIDFDLTRFKMAVERTLLTATSSTVYYPSRPTSATWDSSIFNPSAATTARGLGLGASFDLFPPVEVTVTGYQRANTAAEQPYSARYVIAESTNGTSFTDVATYSSNTASLAHFANASSTHVRVRQYLHDQTIGSSYLIDEQILPILVADGSSTVGAALSNDYHLVPTRTDGSSPVFNDAYTTMHVYVGGVEDTANWTFSATTTNVSGNFGSGATANRYTVTGLSANTGDVTITATKGGTTIVRTFRLEKQGSKNTAIETLERQGRWLTASALSNPDPFRIFFAPGNPNDPLIDSDPETFAVGAGDLVSTSGPSPWFDGITVYIHSVDAEDKTRVSNVLQRVDSGVRLWNGR
ncbi:MAG TPA: hypothetical protein VEA63_07930, partial [Opitutus sp.]|nr:hypothetical protein [Opitutus sp.]